MALPPPVFTTQKDLQAENSRQRDVGKRIGLVPTMGALHEGHISLVDGLQGKADAVFVTIFVNPKQFGANEDLEHYPRQLESDLAALAGHNVAGVFAPSVGEIYGPDFQTTVSVGQVSQGLCGGARPGHFDGVATVVAKLLLLSLPDVAIFGEKDYQQLMVIRQMVKDLAIPVTIVGAPIVRAADGLALSSRNQYLTAEARAKAPLIYQTLIDGAAALRDGAESEAVLKAGAETLHAAGFDVDYYELRSNETLAPLTGQIRPGTGRLLVAAKLGSTRLIDNLDV